MVVRHPRPARRTGRGHRHNWQVTTARLLGYWRQELPELDPRLTVSADHAAAYESLRERGRQWPDPWSFVDPTWRDDERSIVVEHLQTGTLVNQYRGLSPCRFCGRHNGSAELTDGVFCWPEGLAHYLVVHEVRLPEEFVEHVLSDDVARRRLPTPSFDDLGQRDRSWPGAEFEAILWVPDPPADEFGPDLELDPTWWLQQTSHIKGHRRDEP